MNRYSPQYGNFELALQPVPPPAPPPGGPKHDVHIEGEKTEQKAVQRRTVDPLGSYLTWLEERASSWNYRRYRTLLPNAAAAGKILPPIGYLSQPASSFATKFANISVNRIRCGVDSLVWSPDGRFCLTGSHRGEFTLWHGQNFRFEGILQAHEGAIHCMTYSHNENWLVTSDSVGHIKYWKGKNELVKDINAHKDSVRSISFAPSDTKFASASADSNIKIWDFRTCQEDRILTGHARDVLSCDWHPKLSCLVSSSRDYTIRLWDPRAGGEALSSLEGHMNEVTSVAWHRNGHHILSAGRDNQLKIWDTRSMKEISNFAGSSAPINCAAWHPVHEELFVSGDHDGNLAFWLSSRQGPQAEVKGAHEGAVWSLAWNPLGHLLCTGGQDFCARFWSRARPGDAFRHKIEDVPSMLTPQGVPKSASTALSSTTIIPGISDTALAAPGLDQNGAVRPPFVPPRPPRPPPGPPPAWRQLASITVDLPTRPPKRTNKVLLFTNKHRSAKRVAATVREEAE